MIEQRTNDIQINDYELTDYFKKSTNVININNKIVKEKGDGPISNHNHNYIYNIRDRIEKYQEVINNKNEEMKKKERIQQMIKDNDDSKRRIEIEYENKLKHLEYTKNKELERINIEHKKRQEQFNKKISEMNEKHMKKMEKRKREYIQYLNNQNNNTNPYLNYDFDYNY